MVEVERENSKMLRYRLEGSGAPLLLIHGWGVTYAIWQNLAPLLRPHFQLIMIELPGIGGSPYLDSGKPYYQASAEAIEEVRCALGIDQWSILAYSSGTRAAEAYIQRYSRYVARAIFLCPIYLTEWCSLGLRLLDITHTRPTLAHWLFSDWRLYGLVLALGFNGRRHQYTRVWKNEIELQPIDILVRSLCELPGKGRVPFQLPAVPTLFLWGSRDALTAPPRLPRPNDIFIPADHSAPMLAAPNIAEAVIPFVSEGKLIPPTTRLKRRYRIWGKEKTKTQARERARLLDIIRASGKRRIILPRRRLLQRTKSN